MILYTARTPLPLQPASAPYAHLGIVVIILCFLPDKASLQHLLMNAMKLNPFFLIIALEVKNARS